MLVTLSISTREAMLLFGLFWAQFIVGALVPESAAGVERVAVGVTYLLLGLGSSSCARPGSIRPLLRDGFRTPYAHLTAELSEIAGE